MLRIREVATLRRNGVDPRSIAAMLTVRRGPAWVAGRRLVGPPQPGWVLGRARAILGGEYDLPGLEIRRGDVVADVGANIGLFSLLAVHRGARLVRAYEPHPQTARWLAQNVAGLPVEVLPVAVTGAPGMARLWLSPASDTRHSTAVAPSATDGRQESLEVDAVSLSEVIGTGCDVLKLDCEGEEFELIRRAEEVTLRLVRTIVLEVHEYAGNPDRLRADLEAAGFRCRRHRASAGPLSLWVAHRT